MTLTRAERKQAFAGFSVDLSAQSDDALRLLARHGNDAALAELARRHPDDKHLRLDALDGDTPPCHGRVNCCHCENCVRPRGQALRRAA